MRPLKTLALALVITGAFATTAYAQPFPYGYFKVSTNIKQDLSWAVPAQTIECSTYIGAGRTNFSFKSRKATKIIVNSSTIGAPGLISGGGPQSGSMSSLAIPNCNNARDLVLPVSGCGTMSFTPEFVFKQKGSSTYLTSLTATRDFDDHNYDCAIYGQLSSFAEGAIDSCGVKEDGLREIYNQALRDIGAEGITSVKFPFTAKKLLKIKKGKKKSYKRQVRIKCTVPTERGFNVAFDGTVTAALTFKRVK